MLLSMSHIMWKLQRGLRLSRLLRVGDELNYQVYLSRRSNKIIHFHTNCKLKQGNKSAI